MKGQRTVKVKHPTLRALRNNLRLAIISAVKDKYNLISEEWRSLVDPTGMQREIAHNLHDERSSLIQALERSICICPVCNKTDRDMIYFPLFKSWVCINCFESRHEYWEKELNDKIKYENY